MFYRKTTGWIGGAKATTKQGTYNPDKNRVRENANTPTLQISRCSALGVPSYSTSTVSQFFGTQHMVHVFLTVNQRTIFPL